MDDAKQDAFFVQLWDKTGLYPALGRTTIGALAGLVATNAVEGQFSTDGAGRATKGSCNLSHGEVLKVEAGESHALLWFDLLVALGWGNLHLRTLQGWQVLHFTFESGLLHLVLESVSAPP
jgi:hypothetical protein